MTGGSPLLVTAIAQDAKTAGGLVPGPAFRSAVVTCLHRYEPGMVELGQAVAVLGREATAGLLGELLAVSPESAARGLDALGASGLLKSGEFRHEQARQAVLSHMTAGERAAMHGAAARALYRTGASSAVLARHITAAHRIGSRWAVAALREAAEQALAGGETEHAVGYLMRAQVECADDRQRAAIIFALARAEWPADPERAARHLPELVATARSGLLSGDYLGELAHYLLWTGETSSAAEILAALGTSPAGTSPAGTAPAGPAAASRPMEFLYPDAVGRARSAVRDSASPAPSPARPRAGRAGASGAQAGAIHDAAIADRILTERNLNDPALASPAVLASTTAALMGLIGQDMLDQAASWCETLLRESGASSGSPLWRAALTSFSAMIDIRCGDLRTAEDRARSALAMLTPRAWGVAIGVPLSSLLLSTTASGQHEDAATGLRIPVPEAMFGTVYGMLYLSARGEYYLATGRPDTALADFSHCGRRMTAWGLDLPGLIPWRIRSAEAYLALGNPSEARELTEEQLALAGASFPRTRGISLRVLALASPSARRTALLRESAEALRNSGAWLELARTFTELSHAHLALGEHGRAHWAARQARNLAGRCGTQAPAITRPQREASAGQPTGAAAVRLLPQLSDAEQRVATLAAYGYTNGQIARKLYITVSTVEQHLTRVYRKLGVTSRAELPIGL
jgi:DNA-binding CsgD family transcriptional regulator